jgi:hypothetical protein
MLEVDHILQRKGFQQVPEHHQLFVEITLRLRARGFDDLPELFFIHE